MRKYVGRRRQTRQRLLRLSWRKQRMQRGETGETGEIGASRVKVTPHSAQDVITGSRLETSNIHRY